MYNIKTSAEQLVGKTPLLALKRLEHRFELKAGLIAKLENFNLTGSIKDRIAMTMIEEAEKNGEINNDTIIIEPTSGNTGIGLSALASAKGYRIIIVMPDSMSVERIKLMKAYGAEVILTDGSLGMRGAIEKAEEMAKENKNYFIPRQFDNPANAKAHFETTGPEIWNDMDGKVDILVSCVGTGGTITGTGSFLKQKNPDIHIVAVEPFSSPVLSQGLSGAHKIQGIGAGFIPKVLDTDIYDEIIPVKDDDAFEMARQICAYEGVLVGISSGAALWAAIEVAGRTENDGKNIVVILPDSGDSYLSTELL